MRAVRLVQRGGGNYRFVPSHMRQKYSTAICHSQRSGKNTAVSCRTGVRPAEFGAFFVIDWAHFKKPQI